MPLFPRDLEIGLDEGFTPAKDIFGRKEFGAQITKLARALEGPAVLMLDAPWGSGKTTFVKMWRGELTKAGFPTIYFDAFANDYYEDAFLALAGEIIARAEEIQPAPKKILTTFKKRAVSVAKVLGRASLRLGTRVATAGVLTGEEAELGFELATDVAKTAGDEAAKAVDELLNERLGSHRADHAVLTSFREALSALSAGVAERVQQARRNSTETSADKARPPLVFIIDELDRCRPTFALALLEKVKHFFSVPGVIFVLVTNLQQLQSAVRFAYGTDVDAQTYLEKFYQLRLVLPVNTPDRPIGAAATYLNYLFANVLPKGDEAHFVESLKEVIAYIARVHALSLRTLERIGTYCALVLISTNRNTLRITPIVAGLCVLKVISPALYDAAREGRLSYAELQNVLRFDQWQTTNSDASNRRAEWCSTWWKFVLNEPLENNQIKQELSQTLWHYSISNPMDIALYLCRIIDGLRLPELS